MKSFILSTRIQQSQSRHELGHRFFFFWATIYVMSLESKVARDLNGEKKEENEYAQPKETKKLIWASFLNNRLLQREEKRELWNDIRETLCEDFLRFFNGLFKAIF